MDFALVKETNFDGTYFRSYKKFKNGNRRYLTEEEYNRLMELFDEEFRKNKKLWEEVCVDDE